MAIGALPLSGAVPTLADIPATYHLLNKISLPGPEGWDYLTIDSDARRLYVTRGVRLTAIDIDTDKVVGEITGLNGIHGVAIDRKAGKGFISNGRGNSVVVFDLKTLAKIEEVPVGEGPDAIIFDPDTERVFTFNGRAKSSTVIDAKTDKVVGTIPLPGRPEFAVADGKGKVYNNIEDLSEVVSIDTKNLQILNTWPLAPAESPSGISYDDKTGRVFSVCDGQVMTVLDSATGKLVTTLPIGNGPDATVFDEKNSVVYSPNGQDGTLSVYKDAGDGKYTLVDTVTTQLGARTLALDTKTGNVYTVTAQAAPAPPPDPNAPTPQRRRRTYVDGTFVVLEYGK
jgi:DNA-binding beta-propeller fold protein YncE